MNTKKLLITTAPFILIHFIILSCFAQESEIEKNLRQLPEITYVQKIDNHPFFKEAYEITIDQLLDHNNPSAGKFKQRIILSHYNKFSPVVFVTEGYDANYATKSTYINELSQIVEGNQIIVEHRYFGKSMPNDLNWNYLTIENACADLHRIQRIFERIYNNKNKWIATGISKGGQQTMAYKAFYPNDVDIWIPYVAPLNYSVEDERHEKFLATVGKESCRNSITNFQKQVLIKRVEIEPLLDSLITARNFTFKISKEKLLDFCILEYPFAFWQWGENCSSIPSDSSKTKILFDHLVSISSPEYFSKEGSLPFQPFFVQAAKEFGYYSYELGELKPYMKISDTKNYLEQCFLPENFSTSFDNKTSKFINKAIQKNGDHMIFIYGEYDPWTASSVNLKKSSSAIKIIQPKGSHKSRINDLPYGLRGKIYMLLETWLEED